MKSTKKSKTRIGIYAGSFDPPTTGHMWMVEEAATLFDELIVALGLNPEKRSAFTVEERLEMLRSCTAGFKNVRVEIFTNQYLINYARKQGASFIVRGIRSETDYEYERVMRNINGDLDSNVTTIFLMPPRDIAEVSSSMVKGMVGPDGWQKMVQPYLPPAARQQFLKKFMVTTAKTKWLEFWQRLGVKNNPALFFAELEARYSESHRAYHNLAHVMDCLEEFESAKNLAHDPSAVEMAIWYHDAVYDPRAKDNEEQSAGLAAKVGSEIGLPSPLNQCVNNLIIATKKHDASLDRDAALMVDVDLSILGRSPRQFDEYENQIRQEYSWVADAAFAAGRTAVLESFLTRPVIYSTEILRNKYELQARENLKRSIHKLKPAIEK